MDKEEQETLSTPGVMEKYQTAAKIVNGNFYHYSEVFSRLIKKISVGSKIF